MTIEEFFHYLHEVLPDAHKVKLGIILDRAAVDGLAKLDFDDAKELADTLATAQAILKDGNP